MMSSTPISTALIIAGWLVIILVVVAFIRAWRRTGSTPPASWTQNTPSTSPAPDNYPYIRGTDFYRRSYNHRNDTVQVRVSMGLPPSHNDPMWRDPSR